ncbi:MAG: hypothetical protein LBL13_00695 [Bacteroidales bacterium]|jgi:hypothetical protein|nr:hypothetical protein [Bacteroidales bacterium]
MRKIVIASIAIVFVMTNVFAQEEIKKEKNRGGKDFSEILPHAGDFALGLDMANFVKTINNSITNAATGNSVVAFQSDFFGKYFLTDRSAVRARLGIRINNRTDRQFVRDDAKNLLSPPIDPILEEKTVDVYKRRQTELVLGIGYEYRRSLWRVQGYVGGEVFGGVGLNRHILEYGNPMSDANTNPTLSQIQQGLFLEEPAAANALGYRILESVKGNTMILGAAIFIGADFFICRNLSIGAEFDLEGRYNRTGELGFRTETWLLQQAYTAEERLVPVTSSFRLHPTGRLNLSIYF